MGKSTAGRKPGVIRKLTLCKGQKWPRVSNLGRFRSIRGVITRPHAAPSGYKRVKIKKADYQLHALVCRAFIGEAPSMNHTPDHIDNDPSNNASKNLRWASRQEQIRHSYESNKDRKSNAPRQSKPIKGRLCNRNSSDGEEEEWVEYPSSNAAARKLDLDPGSIRACLSGRIKQTGGYEFVRDEEEAEPELLPGEEWRDVVAA